MAKRSKAEQDAANLKRAKLQIDVREMSFKQMCDYLEEEHPQFPMVIITEMQRRRGTNQNLFLWIAEQCYENQTNVTRLHRNQEREYAINKDKM